MSETSAAEIKRLIQSDPPVNIVCECGHDTELSSYTEFKQEVNTDSIDLTIPASTPLQDALKDETFTLTCESCSQSGTGRTARPLDEDIEHQTLIIGTTPIEQLRSRRQIFDSRSCPNCKTKLRESDRYEGPDAPTVGWIYYECPECEYRAHPDGVN